MNFWFVAAAATSFVTFLVHLVLGGREIARPLLAADLQAKPKYTSYYCWHMVTITIAAVALAFALAALPGRTGDLALFATGLSLLFLLWNIVMIVSRRLRFLHYPQWSLFLPGTLLGIVGLMA